MPGRGTKNEMFTLQMICERATQHKQVIILYYTKALNNTKHEKLLKLSSGLGPYDEDIKLIRNLY